MGWWPIDPETGMPAEDKPSRPSPQNEYDGFVLLNADPQVDREPERHYMGDAPWDYAYSWTCEIKELVDDPHAISEADWREYMLKGKIPARLAQDRAVSTELRKSYESFWQEIDVIYDEDWERPATSAEKRWVAEYGVERLLMDDEEVELEAGEGVTIEIESFDMNELQAELDAEDLEDEEYEVEEYEVEEAKIQDFETDNPAEDFEIEEEEDYEVKASEIEEFEEESYEIDGFEVVEDDDESRDYDIEKY